MGLGHPDFPETDSFLNWWSLYRKTCKERGNPYGDRRSAAPIWASLIIDKGHTAEEIHRGTRLKLKEYRASSTSLPHAYIFLKGKEPSHPTPYWLVALEEEAEMLRERDERRQLMSEQNRQDYRTPEILNNGQSPVRTFIEDDEIDANIPF